MPRNINDNVNGQHYFYFKIDIVLHPKIRSKDKISRQMQKRWEKYLVK